MYIEYDEYFKVWLWVGGSIISKLVLMFISIRHFKNDSILLQRVECINTIHVVKYEYDEYSKVWLWVGGSIILK